MTSKQLLFNTIDQVPEQHLATILQLVRSYIPKTYSPRKIESFLNFADTVSFEMPAEYNFDRDELHN